MFRCRLFLNYGPRGDKNFTEVWDDDQPTEGLGELVLDEEDDDREEIEETVSDYIRNHCPRTTRHGL